MQISHTVPVLQEVLEVCSYCLLHAPYLLLLVGGRKSENAADPSASTATINSKRLSAAVCPSPCPPTTGTVLLRGKGKTVLQKSNADGENEQKESTRSVFEQKKRRYLKESMHVNWKCQERPHGTCTIRALVTATAADPTLVRSLFHAVWVSAFPGYHTSHLSMQHLYREKVSVWFNGFHAGRILGSDNNTSLMEKK